MYFGLEFPTPMWMLVSRTLMVYRTGWKRGSFSAVDGVHEGSGGSWGCKCLIGGRRRQGAAAIAAAAQHTC